METFVFDSAGERVTVAFNGMVLQVYYFEAVKLKQRVIFALSFSNVKRLH